MHQNWPKANPSKIEGIGLFHEFDSNFHFFLAQFAIGDRPHNDLKAVSTIDYRCDDEKQRLLSWSDILVSLRS